MPGQVIHYCEKCNKRIPDAEIGKASMLPEVRSICSACAGSHAVAAAAPKRASERMTPERGSRATIPVTQPSRQTGRVRAVPDEAPRRFPKLIVGGVGVLVVVGVVAGIVLLRAPEKPDGDAHGRGSSPVKSGPAASVAVAPPTAQLQRPTGPAAGGGTVAPTSPAALSSAPAGSSSEKQDAYDPRGETANSLLVQAKGYRTANGSDLFGYREKLEYIRTNFNGTKAADEAKLLLDKDAKLPELPEERNPQWPAADAWADAVQLLPMVDTGKDRVSGWWKVENGRLRSDKAMWAMIGLPYTPPEEYDVRMIFERVEHDDCLLVILSRRGKPFIFSIGSGNKNCSFETVRESQADILPTKTVRPNLFPNRARIEIVILVRSQCLRAFLNGKPIVGCQVDDSGLSLHPSLKLPKDGQVGLATWSSVYEFQSFEVRAVKGKGSPLR